MILNFEEKKVLYLYFLDEIIFKKKFIELSHTILNDRFDGSVIRLAFFSSKQLREQVVKYFFH